MSEKKFCHECGYAMDITAKTCPECGFDMTEPAQEPAQEPAVAPTTNLEGPEGAVIGAGARANVTGGVHTNTNTNTQVNTHTNTNTVNETHNVLQNQRTTNANIQTSNVDNSSVVNNTTIVMDGGKKEAEFCEVCGVPFDGKRARCPKCGKMICFDCKVKGKNRCVECEKKAVNEYRLAFQQLLLTTGGNLGTAGRQMMNQKARELEVEDTKAAIEKELMEEYRPAVKAEQPVVTTSAPQQAAETKPTEQSKGGVVDNREPLRPKSNKSSGGGVKWFILVVLLAGVGGYFMLSGGDKSEAKEAKEPVATEQPATAPVETSIPQQQPAKVVQQSAATPAPVAAPAPAAKPAAKPVQTVQPATPKTDANYEAGMAAYNDGDGLEAIKKFNASGSAQANYMLGTIYEKGCGNVTANAMMARKYYKKAALQGSEEAKAKL